MMFKIKQIALFISMLALLGGFMYGGIYVIAKEIPPAVDAIVKMHMSQP